MLLTFWLQTSPFHSSSWKSHSIHYLCQAPCAVLAGRLYFEASMQHILNVMLQLSHAEIYLGCLKPDFSRIQNYITSELSNTLSFHLCLLKLGENVAQGGGEKPIKQINSSLHLCNYYSVILILLMSPTNIWPAWGKKDWYTTSLLH